MDFSVDDGVVLRNSQGPNGDTLTYEAIAGPNLGATEDVDIGSAAEVAVGAYLVGWTEASPMPSGPPVPSTPTGRGTTAARRVGALPAGLSPRSDQHLGPQAPGRRRTGHRSARLRHRSRLSDVHRSLHLDVSGSGLFSTP
ncbi:hypothetical protein ACIGMX_45960 [Streptomyces aquilus]|uniref:hypothetical protein n=1 Tax=Streptomyces aquilus TaxID=2548456 RepID=UPI0037D5FBD1